MTTQEMALACEPEFLVDLFAKTYSGKGVVEVRFPQAEYISYCALLNSGQPHVHQGLACFLTERFSYAIPIAFVEDWTEDARRAIAERAKRRNDLLPRVYFDDRDRSVTLTRGADFEEPSAPYRLSLSIDLNEGPTVAKHWHFKDEGKMDDNWVTADRSFCLDQAALLRDACAAMLNDI